MQKHYQQMQKATSAGQNRKNILLSYISFKIIISNI